MDISAKPENQQPQPAAPQSEAAPGPSPPAPGEHPTTPFLPPEGREAFPTHFARLFFGAITLLVLYFSYLIIKPYLLDIFMALVLFFTAKPLFHVLTRLLFGKKALASALTCIILLLVILLPLFTLLSIIATQALEFSTNATRALQSGEFWQWVTVKVELLKNYLIQLNLPLPPEQIKLDQIVRTVVNNASAFIYTNAIGLIRGFTYFFFDLVLVLFIAFFMFLQGDDFINAVQKLSPLRAAHNEEIIR